MSSDSINPCAAYGWPHCRQLRSAAEFPDLGTHLKRRTWRPPRTRTARLLTPPARRGGPRQPLAAITETVPGVVRTHRLQRAQLLFQRRDPTRQPTALLRPLQGLPQDRIRLAQRLQLATQFAILLAQRRDRRPPPRIHRHLFAAAPSPAGATRESRPAPLPASPYSDGEWRPARPPGCAPRSPPAANTPRSNDRRRRPIPAPKPPPASPAIPQNPLSDAHSYTRYSTAGSMCPAAHGSGATGIARKCRLAQSGPITFKLSALRTQDERSTMVVKYPPYMPQKTKRLWRAPSRFVYCGIFPGSAS